jgi:hypothetical protein
MVAPLSQLYEIRAEHARSFDFPIVVPLDAETARKISAFLPSAKVVLEASRGEVCVMPA